MFIKVTEKPNGSTFVRTMEPIRHQDKITQKNFAPCGQFQDNRRGVCFKKSR